MSIVHLFIVALLTQNIVFRVLDNGGDTKRFSGFVNHDVIAFNNDQSK